VSRYERKGGQDELDRAWGNILRNRLLGGISVCHVCRRWRSSEEKSGFEGTAERAERVLKGPEDPVEIAIDLNSIGEENRPYKKTIEGKGP